MIDKNLGHVTAYAYAVEKGYTGTEEEFAELMASYATVAESAAESAEAAAGSATSASASASSASQSASAASESATSASSSESTAREKAGEASESASSASTSAQTATTKANEASGSATTASTKASEASSSAQTATTKASEASASEASASAYKLVSEGYAVGKQNGEDVESGSPYYENNAKYYAEQAEETLGSYAKVDGYYDAMSVGSAEQLISTVFVEDQTPYQFRTSGGSVDIGNRETDMIVGGTITWNQLVQNGNFADDTDNWSVQSATYGSATASDGELTYTLSALGTEIYHNMVKQSINTLKDHVYLNMYDMYVDKQSIVADIYLNTAHTVTINSGWNRLAGIMKPSSSYSVARYGLASPTGYSAGDTYKMKNVNLIDLTLLFGSTIANYIYSLEQANAGAGISYFRKLFPNMDAEYTYTDASDVEHTQKLRDYQSGVLLSVSGLQSHDMVGFNAWDEEWEVGRYDTTTGNPTTSTTQIRCKNFIPVLPNTNYYVKGTNKTGVWIQFYDADKKILDKAVTDNRWNNSSGKSLQYKDNVMSLNADCHYIRFYLEGSYGTTYTHDICINLSWDGERDGEYEPYEKHSYALDSSLTLRGIPKLDASNNLCYDGDTYESSGKVTRKYGIVDLGTLTWSYKSAGFFSANIRDFKAPSADRALIYAITNKYLVATVYDFQASPTDKTFTLGRTGFYSECVLIRDSSYTDAIAFKTAMNGVYLVYELATPTTESAEPYTNPQVVDDFGTEEYVTDSIVPVGHFTEYMNNLRAKLEMAPESPSGDGDYIVRQANGENSYVALASTTTIQSILARLEALEGGN